MLRPRRLSSWLFPRTRFDWSLPGERADCRAVAHRGHAHRRIRRIGDGRRNQSCRTTLSGSNKHQGARKFAQSAEKGCLSQPLKEVGVRLRLPIHEKTPSRRSIPSARGLRTSRGAGFQSDRKGFGGRLIRSGPQPSRLSSSLRNKGDAWTGLTMVAAESLVMAAKQEIPQHVPKWHLSLPLPPSLESPGCSCIRLSPGVWMVVPSWSRASVMS